MKFEDFSTPRFLLEQAENEIKSDLDVIEKELNSAQPSDANLVVQAKSLLQMLVNQAQGVLNRFHHDNHENGNLGPTPQKVTEDTSTYILIHELENQISQICITVPNCDPIVNTLRNSVHKLRSMIEGAFEAEKAAGRAEAQKAALDFMNQIDALLLKLAQKIDGFVVPHYKNAGYKKSDINKMKTREKTQNSLMSLFDSLFRKKIQTGDITQDQALTFAKGAAEGEVLDMRGLVNNEQRHGSIDAYVNPVYREVYSAVIKDMLNTMPAGTGAIIGPGEIALLALGNASTKAPGKGDMVIDGALYEVKAGGYQKGYAPTGGRLNGNKIQTSKAAHDSVLKMLKQNHKILWDKMNMLFDKGEWKGKYVISGITESGTKNYEKALNLANYSKQQTIEFLHDLGKQLVIDYDDTVSRRSDHFYHDLIDSAVTQTPEGIHLSYKGLMKAFSFIQHESYKNSDKFNHMLLLNKFARTFTIIDSGEDFVSKINDGTVLPAKGLSINASDPQSATFHYTSK